MHTATKRDHGDDKRNKTKTKTPFVMYFLQMHIL